MTQTRRRFLSGVAIAIGASLVTKPVLAATAQEIDQDADRALQSLYTKQSKARDLGKRAAAILIFPKIVKAGFLVGGQSGDGALRVNGKTVGYYNISAGSFGLQAGVQTFSNVMFFMTAPALKYLTDSDGWAIGSGPSVVVVDKGAAGGISSTTLTQDVYAFPFGQKGLMAGLGLEGSKISHITPDK